MPNDLSTPSAFVPRIKPEEFDDYGVVRETFLAEVYDDEARATFRAFARMQQSLVREASLTWPYRDSDTAAHRLQAVLADLRHLQGFLAFELEYLEGCGEAEQEDPLWNVARRLHGQIGAMAEELDREVGGLEVKKSR